MYIYVTATRSHLCMTPSVRSCSARSDGVPRNGIRRTMISNSLPLSNSSRCCNVWKLISAPNKDFGATRCFSSLASRLPPTISLTPPSMEFQEVVSFIPAVSPHHRASTLSTETHLLQTLDRWRNTKAGPCPCIPPKSSFQELPAKDTNKLVTKTKLCFCVTEKALNVKCHTVLRRQSAKGYIPELCADPTVSTQQGTVSFFARALEQSPMHTLVKAQTDCEGRSIKPSCLFFWNVGTKKKPQELKGNIL